MRKAGTKPRSVPRFKIFLIFTIAVFAVIMFLLSPIFNIVSIDISGNSAVANSTIKDIAGISENMNIFAVASSKIEKRLSAISYIKKADVSRIYPGTLKIDITERKVSGYVDYKQMSTYILIDADGVVLETKTYITESQPIIVGLDFQNVVIGEVLETENRQSFRTAVNLSKLFEKYELSNVSKIDVSDVDNIHLYIDNIDILFGSMEDADAKLQEIKQISAAIPEGTRCILEKYDTDKYLFKYLK